MSPTETPVLTPVPSASSLEEPETRFSLPGFFKGVAEAWRKVTWPAKGHLALQVVITLLVTTLATTLIWGMDSLYRFLIQTFIVRGGA
jgi:preprotein translocase SecE subunit